ncbi:MAG: cytochrome P450 [Acidimicrobiia bacterium]|nr:cytochrome P450 [Acidimicrobiia bacterium]
MSGPFDPATLRTLEDPFPTYATLRAHGPVAELAGGRSGVFAHATASFVLRDPRFRSGTLGFLYAATLPPGALHDEMSRRINFLDPPDHPRVRGLVAKAFTPRRVKDLRPWVDATARRLVHELPIVDGTVELMTGLAHQLPSLVISELLGVPVEVRDQLTELSDAITPIFGTSVSADDRATAVAAAEVMHAVLGTELDRRRAEPSDDLLTALVHAEEDGERLSHPELMSLVATLYSAGHRTTRDLFGNGFARLLQDGAPLSLPVDAAVIEEITRLATPTHYVARFASEAVDVGGVRVEAGTPVMVFLAAANRDPDVYERPDGYEPGRSGPPALSFALGPHFCLGASLARMEVEAMMTAVIDRFPEATAGGAPGSPPWHQRGPFRGLDALTVTVA